MNKQACGGSGAPRPSESKHSCSGGNWLFGGYSGAEVHRVAFVLLSSDERVACLKGRWRRGCVVPTPSSHVMLSHASGHRSTVAILPSHGDAVQRHPAENCIS